MERSGSRLPSFEKAETANYVISKEDGVTKAKDGSDGSIASSDTDASTVIQNAIDALPLEGGLIFLKAGTYTLTSTIELIKQNITLTGGQATLELADGADTNLVKLEGKQSTGH